MKLILIIPLVNQQFIAKNPSSGGQKNYGNGIVWNYRYVQQEFRRSLRYT